MSEEYKRSFLSAGLFVIVAFVLGVGSNSFRSQPLPLFGSMPKFFPGEISVDEAYLHYRQKGAHFWDARSLESYQKAHLPGALPADELPSQGRMVIVYCSGRLCPKAAERAEELRGRGFDEVWVMPDGIQGWHGAGYPLSRGRK